MRYIYTVLFYLALPFIFIRLGWKSRHLPAYRQRLLERLGCYPFRLKEAIWVHAVSMGETIAATPLVKAIQKKYPHLPIVITTMTPTGAKQVKTAFGDSVTHAYLAYDVPDAVQRFLKAVNPRIGIIIETELWPNLIRACHQKNIPVCLLNARLSEKSARGYRSIAPIARAMLQELTVIASHGEEDAKRFIALGAPNDRVVVTGNIKFDLELPTDLSAKIAALQEVVGAQRFCWVAASTHEGEEEMILAAHQLLCEKNPDSLLILVPRHPDRFDHVAKLAEKIFKIARRSKNERCTAEVAVYLGDTMGELLIFYGVADVAFVGGSLIPRGGHNVLEAAALQKPLLTGPHVFNFAEITELFVISHALIKVSSARDLADQLIRLMQDEPLREKMGQFAYQVMAANRGALKRQLDLIDQFINS